MKVDLEQRLINPPQGSALAFARDSGIDLSLLAERLQLTPEERLQQVMRALDRMILPQLEALRELARED